jgi:hypothetical protein
MRHLESGLYGNPQGVALGESAKTLYAMLGFERDEGWYDPNWTTRDGTRGQEGRETADQDEEEAGFEGDMSGWPTRFDAPDPEELPHPDAVSEVRKLAEKRQRPERYTTRATNALVNKYRHAVGQGVLIPPDNTAIIVSERRGEMIRNRKRNARAPRAVWSMHATRWSPVWQCMPHDHDAGGQRCPVHPHGAVGAGVVRPPSDRRRTMVRSPVVRRPSQQTAPAVRAMGTLPRRTAGVWTNWGVVGWFLYFLDPATPFDTHGGSRRVARPLVAAVGNILTGGTTTLLRHCGDLGGAPFAGVPPVLFTTLPTRQGVSW